jgi:hypothetical protein
MPPRPCDGAISVFACATAALVSNRATPTMPTKNRFV